MNDPPRTTDDPAAPRALARLVRGARADGPSEAELAALTAAVHARVESGAPSGAGASAPRARIRWLSRALPAAALVVGAAALLSRVERGATAPRAPVVTAPAPSQPVAPAHTPAPSRPVAPVVIAPAPVVPAASAAHAGPTTHADAPASAPCDLAAHLRAVDSARRSLREGAPSASLDLLTRDRRACPRGVLAEERDRIEIESLLALDRRPEAARRLAQFAREHPGSLHLLQLRTRMDNDAAPAIPSRP